MERFSAMYLVMHASTTLHFSPDDLYASTSNRLVAWLSCVRGPGKTCVSVKTSNTARRGYQFSFSITWQSISFLNWKLAKKTLVNYWWFAKFAKVFYGQNFVLYSDWFIQRLLEQKITGTCSINHNSLKKQAVELEFSHSIHLCTRESITLQIQACILPC